MLRLCLILASFLAVAQRPNITLLLIMVDDMGYAGPSAAPLQSGMERATHKHSR